MQIYIFLIRNLKTPPKNRGLNQILKQNSITPHKKRALKALLDYLSNKNHLAFKTFMCESSNPYALITAL